MWSKLLARLRNNFSLKLLAFCMALITSIFVRTMAEPMQDLPSQRIYTKQIDVLSPTDNELICSINPKEITVTVSGKKNVIDRIDPNLVSAVVDLRSRVKPGTTLEKIDVMAPGGAEISQVDPSHVWAAVSKRTFSSVPVRVSLLGRPANNFRFDTPMPEPTKVRIVGSMENVDKVLGVVVPISVSGASSTFSTKATTLNPIDANGEKVEDVEIYTSSIFVTVPIYPVHNVKVDLTNVDIRGRAGVKYDVSCSPAEIALSGGNIETAGLDSVQVERCVFDMEDRPVSRPVKVVVPSQYKVHDLDKGCVVVTVAPAGSEAKPVAEDLENSSKDAD